jgi:hypothetical protein
VFADKPAEKLPSEKNCRFRKLTVADCPQKIHADRQDKEAAQVTFSELPIL